MEAKSTKGKSLAPTNSNISRLIPSRVGAHRRRPLEEEEETSSESSSSSHSESSSDEDETTNRYFLFVLHWMRFFLIYIYYYFIFVTYKRELSPVAMESMKDGIRRERHTQRPMSKLSLDSNSSDDDYDPYEYGVPRVKPRENENPRQSALEAAKKLKRNFAVPSGDEDDEWSEISNLCSIQIKNS